MKHILSRAACLCFLLATVGKTYAQYSNPILTTPADVQGAALGHVAALSREMPLYSLPTLVFDRANERPSLSYSFGVTPTKDRDHRQYFHALASSYRLGQQHAVMLGGRYWQGMPTLYANATGTKLGVVHPQDWTLDLAYAYAFSPKVKLSAGLSYLNTYSSQTSHSVMAHFGATTQGQLSILRDGAYLVGLSVRNLGTKMRYGKEGKSSNSLPTYVEGTGRVGCTPIQGDNLQLGMSLRYYTSISGAQAFVCQAGAEYQFRRLLSVRLGGIYQQDNSQMTLGVGKSFGTLDVSLAYSLHAYAQFNVLNMGLSLSL